MTSSDARLARRSRGSHPAAADGPAGVGGGAEAARGALGGVEGDEAQEGGAVEKARALRRRGDFGHRALPAGCCGGAVAGSVLAPVVAGCNGG